MCVCIYEIAHNRAIRPCHPSHSMPLVLILPHTVLLFVFSILSRRCPLLATFLSVLLCLLPLLISDSRFDLVWFRLSCDHGWIRSGSVNVKKTTTVCWVHQRIRCTVPGVCNSCVESNYVLLLLQMMKPLLLCCQQGEEPTRRRMEYGTAGETSMPPSKCGCFGSAA